jgi:hypothetical protein
MDHVERLGPTPALIEPAIGKNDVLLRVPAKL